MNAVKTKLTLKLFILLIALFLCFSSQAQAAYAVTTTTDLYYPALDTVIGNPTGKVTLVEFFDYRCPYCRNLAGILQDILKANPQVRLVYRDDPLLGLTSEFAAQAAMAAALQEKYLPLHMALFATRTPLSTAVINALAQQVGINVKKMDADMAGVVATQQLQENATFGQSLNINGVPVIIVAATPDKLSVFPVQAILLISPTSAELEEAIAQVSGS